jgi:hypothetical protein
MMRKHGKGWLWIPAACLLVLACPTFAADVAGQETAWKLLKRLAGTWDSYVVGQEERRAVISYHVTSRGSVLFEEFLGKEPGGVRSMVTAYHFDVDQLAATHYCGVGNQPRMPATSYDPERRLLRFEYWDVTNLADPQAYYTTDIELVFESDENAELRFRGITAGDPGEWQVHRLRRLTRRPYEREEP